jgi:hypothetical protein
MIKNVQEDKLCKNTKQNKTKQKSHFETKKVLEPPRHQAKYSKKLGIL